MPILTTEEIYEVERPVKMLTPRRGYPPNGEPRLMYPEAFQSLFTDHDICAVQCDLHLTGGRLLHATGMKLWRIDKQGALTEVDLDHAHHDILLAVARFASLHSSPDPLGLIERDLDPDHTHYQAFYLPRLTVIARDSYTVLDHLQKLQDTDPEESFYLGPQMDELLGFAYAIEPQSNHERIESHILIQRDLERQTSIMNAETGFRIRSILKEARP
jgi:hypothetical protein